MVRDPAVYHHGSVLVLSGTGRNIVEYPSSSDPGPAAGQGYGLTFLAPDGDAAVHDKNANWGANFLSWSDDLYMYTSLDTPPGLDFTLKPTATDRQVYALRAVRTGSKTAGGFPLEWRLTADTPLFATDSYEGRPYRDPVTADVYIFHDHGKAAAKSNVCIWSRKLHGPTQPASDEVPLLCPGPWDSARKEWDVLSPYPNEVRFPDGGGIVEGSWIHYSASESVYYVFYSSGAYESADNYGSRLALCKTLIGPCTKVVTGSDVANLIPGSATVSSALGYSMMGRPYPIIVDDRLHNIIYHARSSIDFGDDILRCTTRPPLSESFLSTFVAGGAACPPTAPEAFCGNGQCDGAETADSCVQDCGDCASAATLHVVMGAKTYHPGDPISASFTADNNHPDRS